MQWDEWDRREATLQKQLQVREQSDREGQERRFTAAVRTVAIEAVNNAVALTIVLPSCEEVSVRAVLDRSNPRTVRQPTTAVRQASFASSSATDCDRVYGSLPV
jgi:hypothetical protein